MTGYIFLPGISAGDFTDEAAIELALASATYFKAGTSSMCGITVPGSMVQLSNSTYLTPFIPLELFSGGAQGVWYDPGDLSTLFQDASGTVPVTLTGQSVARMNDKSGNGNHAVQVVTSAQPTFAVIPASGRRNLSGRSEPNTAALANSTGVSNAATGLTGFDATIQFPGGTVGDRFAYRDHGAKISTEYTLSVFVRMDDEGAPVPGTDFEIVVGNASSGAGYAAPISLGSGLWRVARTLTSLSTNLQNTGVLKTDSHSARGFRVSGFQLESGATMTAYQRARSAYDLTEAGVTSLPHLSFDGVDDMMSTVTADFMTGSAASAGLGARLMNLGEVLCYRSVPGITSAAFTYRMVSKELVVQIYRAGVGQTSISGGTITNRSVVTNHGVASSWESRLNGLVVDSRSLGTALDFAAQAAGQRLYVGSYGNGNYGQLNLFGLVFINANLSGAEISELERFIASRTGVSL